MKLWRFRGRGRLLRLHHVANLTHRFFAFFWQTMSPTQRLRTPILRLLALNSTTAEANRTTAKNEVAPTRPRTFSLYFTAREIHTKGISLLFRLFLTILRFPVLRILFAFVLLPPLIVGTFRHGKDSRTSLIRIATEFVENLLLSRFGNLLP